MRMRVTEEILHIVEIEDRYIRNDGRQIYTYIYKQKISIDITCVGLASARPNDKYGNQWRIQDFNTGGGVLNDLRAKIWKLRPLLLTIPTIFTHYGCALLRITHAFHSSPLKN